jgi:small subunit ribosomal protein S20
LPNTQSAKKQVRVNARKSLRNKSVRSLLKSNIVKAESLIFSGELKQAEQAVVTAASSLDNAAGKGIIEANSAARRKARLVKKLNQAKPQKPAA